MNLDIWYPVITDLLIRKYGWTNQTIARISTLELRHRSPSWNMGYSWSSMKFWTNALLTSRSLNKESWFRCSPNNFWELWAWMHNHISTDLYFMLLIQIQMKLSCHIAAWHGMIFQKAELPNPMVCHSFSTKQIPDMATSGVSPHCTFGKTHVLLVKCNQYSTHM